MSISLLYCIDNISFITYLAITEAKQDCNNESLQQKTRFYHLNSFEFLFVWLNIKICKGLKEIFVFYFFFYF